MVENNNSNSNSKICKHTIDINFTLLKMLLNIKAGQVCRYATPIVQIDFVNSCSKKDLKDLANWIMTSGVANEKKIEEEKRR
jgi:hypothetical protein